MIEVSDSTRSGRCSAIVCAIMPPIEMPSHVGGLDAEVVEQAEAVIGHVRRVYGGGPRGRRTSAPGRCGGDARAEPAGPTGVAVVVADHVEALGRQQAAEVDVPPGHRAAEPHDQQHGRRVGVAERLVADVEIALIALHVGEPLLRGAATAALGAGLVAWVMPRSLSRRRVRKSPAVHGFNCDGCGYRHRCGLTARDLPLPAGLRGAAWLAARSRGRAAPSPRRPGSSAGRP